MTPVADGIVLVALLVTLWSTVRARRTILATSTGQRETAERVGETIEMQQATNEAQRRINESQAATVEALAAWRADLEAREARAAAPDDPETAIEEEVARETGGAVPAWVAAEHGTTGRDL
ncbi:hypothetical protein ACR9E3_29680 [Actinomycetospora sp. C-140]